MSASHNRRAAIGYGKLDRWRDAGWSKGQSRDSATADSAPSFTPNRHNSIENRPLRALWRQKCVQETKVLQTCAQLRPKIVARASKRAVLRVLHNPLGRSGRPLGVQKRSQNSQEARKHLPKGCPRGSKRRPRGSPRPFLSA